MFIQCEKRSIYERAQFTFARKKKLGQSQIQIQITAGGHCLCQDQIVTLLDDNIYKNFVHCTFRAFEHTRTFLLVFLPLKIFTYATLTLKKHQASVKFKKKKKKSSFRWFFLGYDTCYLYVLATKSTQGRSYGQQSNDVVREMYNRMK